MNEDQHAGHPSPLAKLSTLHSFGARRTGAVGVWTGTSGHSKYRQLSEPCPRLESAPRRSVGDPARTQTGRSRIGESASDRSPRAGRSRHRAGPTGKASGRPDRRTRLPLAECPRRTLQWQAGGHVPEPGTLRQPARSDGDPRGVAPLLQFPAVPEHFGLPDAPRSATPTTGEDRDPRVCDAARGHGGRRPIRGGEDRR